VKQNNKLKIINDPIYGFITIPSPLIFDLIEHKYFQRLRRISQMGLSYLVYPGAHHTRFHHALGCIHLMGKAIKVLRFKGVEITNEEEEALLIAILLHDIGHGPFSHALEHMFAEDVSHEYISLSFMKALNEEFEGKLSTAIDIFTDNYPKQFLCQLLSSQLDMDRLDYLKRDSFYTGVAEGNVNSERLISMLNVKDDQIVVEEKGIYSVEKFLVARRLMYWQVYLHKTGLCAEQLLVKIILRAKELLLAGKAIYCSDELGYFLKHQINCQLFNQEALQMFAQLDDYDVIYAIKQWSSSSDFVLRNLAQMILERRLPKVKLKNKPIPHEKVEAKLDHIIKKHQLTNHEASYFVFTGETQNLAYKLNSQPIKILYKNGKLKDVSKASDQLNLKALSKLVTKHYFCYPKNNY
jgi:HD superfamily phosphohydrolase